MTDSIIDTLSKEKHQTVLSNVKHCTIISPDIASLQNISMRTLPDYIPLLKVTYMDGSTNRNPNFHNEMVYLQNGMKHCMHIRQR